MNPYQKAIKALEDCVKDSMENNIDPGLQMEIWRHYQGMKCIYEQLQKTDSSVQFFLSESEGRDLYDPDYNIQAAQPVDNISLDTGKDVITFS